jgi:hypothetical protein
MSRAWRVIITIVLIAVIFATVCVGVGLLTGADFSRIYSVFDNRYNVEMYYKYVTEDLYNWFISLF